MLHTKFWLESLLAAASGLLCVIMLVWRDWIELTLHVDPDRGSGTLEWSIAGGLFALCFVSAALARLVWRAQRC